jgi:hypothetical protein
MHIAVEAEMVTASGAIPFAVDATLLACNISILYSIDGGVSSELGFVPLLDQVLRIEPGRGAGLGISGKFQITNFTLWDAFSKDLLMSASAKWELAVLPYAQVSVLGRTYQVDFSKSVTLDGLNGLYNSFEIKSFSMTNSTESAVIVDLVAEIKDPSPVLEVQSLGKLSLNMAYDGIWMGSIVTLHDVSLAPNKTQSVPLRAVIESSQLIIHNGADKIAAIKTKLGQLLSNIASFKDVSMDAQGSWDFPTNTTNASQSTLTDGTPPLFNAALKHLKVSATITSDVLHANLKPLVEGFSIRQMNVTPLTAERVALSQQVTIFALSPLGEVAGMTVHSVSFPPVSTKLVINGSLIAGVVDAPPITEIVQTRIGSQIILNVTLTGYLSLADKDDKVSDKPIYDYTSNFVSFVKAFAKDTSVNAALIGRADVTVTVDALRDDFGSLSLQGVPIDISTNLVALAGFTGSEVPDFVLPADAPGGGEIILINTTFPNPTVVTLTLAKSYFNVTYLGSYIGHIVSDGELAVAPGSNLLGFSGVVNPNNLEVANSFFTNYLLGVDSVLVASGDRVEIPAGHPPIPWLDQILPSVSLSAVVHGIHDFQLISNVNIETLTFRFEMIDGMQQPIATGRMGADYTTPPIMAFPFNVIAVNMTILMSFNDTIIGHLDVPMHPASSTPTGPGHGHLSVEFADQVLWVDSFTGFESYMVAMFMQERAKVDLTGRSTAVAQTNMGNVSLIEIPFVASVDMKGVDQFSCPLCVVVTSVDLVGGQPGEAYFTLSLDLTNPSSAGMVLGRLGMDIWYQGRYIGSGVIPHTVLNVGMNVFTVYATFYQRPNNGPEGRAFLSNFITGHDLNVTLYGERNGTDILMAKRGFSMVRAPAIIRGYHGTEGTGIIRYGQLIWSWKIFKLQLPVRLTIENRFNSSIGISAAKFTVSHKGTTIGLVDVNFENDPIMLQPRQISITRELVASIEGFTIDYLRTLFGKINIDVEGEMEILIRNKISDPTGFVQKISYSQQGIPASFQKEGMI